MRNKRKYFMFILMSFLLGSCGGQKRSGLEELSKSMSVDWEEAPHRVRPQIEEGPSNFDGSYGPVPQELFSSERPKEKVQKPSSLILGPGGSRILAYLSLLKELHLRNETPHIVLGHGLGAILATYYAFGLSPDYIEWKFFKFAKEAKDEEIFSEDWIELVDKILLDEFKGKKIEEGKLTLIIPVYSREQEKVKYLKRGELRDALLANIDVNNTRTSSYSPAFFREIINQEEFDKWGAGEALLVDLISCGLRWEKERELIKSYFKRAISLISKNKLKNEYRIEYSLEGFALDDLSKTTELIYRSKGVTQEQIQQWELSHKKGKDKL